MLLFMGLQIVRHDGATERYILKQMSLKRGV